MLNTVNAAISFGCLPSVSTYALLPFGQKAFYYWSVLTPMACPLSLVLSLRWKSLSDKTIVGQSLLNWSLCMLIFIIAKQSPCPWLADTAEGAMMVIGIWFVMSFISNFLRITIGNRIKEEWSGEQGMFYYGGSAQLGLLLGTIPTYFVINVLNLFVDRKPCETYCLT